ncbi:MAG: hypothetical protein L0H10_07175 [Comamonas sp.]|nr:hypothetical protein [Comamonas sp.]
MGKKNISRYELLSDMQRDALRSQPSSVLISTRFSSFIGPLENRPFFEKALCSLEKSLDGWATKDLWIKAYILWSKDVKRKSKRGYGTIVSQFVNGFVKFVDINGDSGKFEEILTKDYIFRFELWLMGDKNFRLNESCKASNVSPGTARRHYGVIRAFVEELHRNDDTGKFVQPLSIFKKRTFEGAGVSGKPTPILSDVEWVAFCEAVFKTCYEIKNLVEEDWKLLEGEPILRDENKRGSGKYTDFGAALWALKKYFPSGLIPSSKEIAGIDKALKNSILGCHGYRRITLCFAPSVATVLPFFLLLSIYTLANTGSLRGLKIKNVKECNVLGVERLSFEFFDEEDSEQMKDGVSKSSAQRISYEIEKGRIHSSYIRSFPIDDSDPLSPSCIHRFLLRWTRDIRKYADSFDEHLFIFAGHSRIVRGFHSANHSGSDTDSSWKQAMSQFCIENSLDKITIGKIRTTGLNIINEQNNGDLPSTRDAAGHKRGSSTFQLNYMGAAARNKLNENLASVVVTMPRWVESQGSSQIRGAPDHADAGAATPGWHCLDPFESPIPGEHKGRLCSAYGRCPICPLGAINHKSSYSLARVIQLREEVERALTYLSYERWVSVFLPVRSALDSKWIPLFIDEHVQSEARILNLNPLGRLE